MTLRRGKGGKTPPFLSQEFIIQNHGDIVSCVCMVIMVGLMFQATQGIAQVFIAAQHNVTRPVNGSTKEFDVHYTNGWKDFCGIFFYSLCWIVVQAIIQEYILDKLNRRFHMSKTKTSKFNDSGNLIPFFLFSIGMGIKMIQDEKLVPKIQEIWEGYPHLEMTFLLKFFFILQIAYWIHMYPELYFMKTRREEIMPKVQQYTQYLVFIAAAYVMNFTRVTLILLVVHYIPELVFHISRIFHCAGKDDIAQNGFTFWTILFVLARLITVSLAILMFWFGLGKAEKQGFDAAAGNFNNQTVRLACLLAIVLLQTWMAFNFIMSQMKRYRESASQSASGKKKSQDQRKRGKKDKKTKESKEEKDDSSVVQNGSPKARIKQD